MVRLLTLTLLSVVQTAVQGFSNLDFEHPHLPLVPDWDQKVATSDAIPAWSAYIGGVQVDKIGYNGKNLDLAGIFLIGPGALSPVIQGKFRVYLEPGLWNSPSTGIAEVAIAQDGMLSPTALSVRFYMAEAAPEVYFAGQALSVRVLGAGSGDSLLYGADVSRFAGQFGELRFSGSGYLDNIFFSPQAVPEPGVLALLALGGVLLGWLRGRNRR
jgi:hypothetical protein